MRKLLQITVPPFWVFTTDPDSRVGFGVMKANVLIER